MVLLISSKISDVSAKKTAEIVLRVYPRRRRFRYPDSVSSQIPNSICLKNHNPEKNLFEKNS